MTRTARPTVRRRLIAALTAAAFAAGGLIGLVASSSPATAWGSPNVSLTGHGFGHGRGMGQWGAYGYATSYGWSYSQILAHYYGGTTVTPVGLAAMTVDLTALDGSGSLTVTSGAAFTAGGVAVPANGAAKLTYVGTNSFTVQTNSTGCGKTLSAAKPVAYGLVKSTVAGPSSFSQLLTICNTDGSTRAYRGTLSLTYGGGATRVVNTLGMDDYLRGVVPRESPAYWGDAAGGKGMAALQAQAVAARSYAAVSNRYSWAKICDSQSCQVYGGAVLNGTVIEDARTSNAVASTSARVLVSNSGGGVVSAEYSSSTGGWTAGGTFPAVQDLGDNASPYHNWTDTVPAATIGSRYGIGTLQAISVTRNGLGADGGRVLTATVKGTAGSRTVTGSQFASDFGLLSDWFTVTNPVVPTLYYTNSLTSPTTAISQAFGIPHDLPLACDFNGDGTDTGAVYRQSNETFYIRNSFSPGAPLTTVKLGAPGDVPVCGDWDGNGTDTVGVYRPSTAMFYLINDPQRTSSTRLIQVLLGGHGYRPIAGDWNGDHKDTVGVFDPVHATFYLVNTLAPGSPRLKYQYGNPNDLPVAGDWDGNGKDSFGVFQGTRFALTNTPGSTQVSYTAYGQPGDQPIAGDWNHDKIDTVGVGRGY